LKTLKIKKLMNLNLMKLILLNQKKLLKNSKKLKKKSRKRGKNLC